MTTWEVVIPVVVAAAIAIGVSLWWRAQRGVRMDDPARLAELLPLEIELYHEDELAAAQRERCVRERFRDDIARARELFEAQVPLGCSPERVSRAVGLQRVLDAVASKRHFDSA